jgi:hypothetical protein
MSAPSPFGAHTVTKDARVQRDAGGLEEFLQRTANTNDKGNIMRTFAAGLCRTSILLALLGAASTAGAQQVGTYSGNTADGSGISFTVGIDPDTGAYEFTGAGIGFNAYCKRSNYTFSSGWGFGLGQDILSGNNNIVVNANQYNYFYVNYNLTFPDDNTIQGKVNTDTAVFESGNPPTKADFCKAPKNQTFTATFQGPGHATLPPGAAAVYYGKMNASSH